uniref:Uncharacterized protein n=1 Tax=Rhizophora mucronata TaxID=61149 RepID=A0A2P2P9M9_RHIMU
MLKEPMKQRTPCIEASLHRHGQLEAFHHKGKYESFRIISQNKFVMLQQKSR